MEGTELVWKVFNKGLFFFPTVTTNLHDQKEQLLLHVQWLLSGLKGSAVIIKCQELATGFFNLPLPRIQGNGNLKCSTNMTVSLTTLPLSIDLTGLSLLHKKVLCFQYLTLRPQVTDGWPVTCNNWMEDSGIFPTGHNA